MSAANQVTNKTCYISILRSGPGKTTLPAALPGTRYMYVTDGHGQVRLLPVFT